MRSHARPTNVFCSRTLRPLTTARLTVRDAVLSDGLERLIADTPAEVRPLRRRRERRFATGT